MTFLIGAAGWSGLTHRLEDDPESRTAIEKQGWGVIVSGVFAPLSAGAGSYFMTHSMMAAVIAAMAIFVLVLLVDRTYVFASETQTRVSKLALVRFFLLAALAVPTALGLFAAFNHKALTAAASDYKRERVIERGADFDTSTGLTDARHVERDLQTQLAALRTQRLQTPPDIVRQREEAATCVRRVRARLAALLRQGLNRGDARAVIAADSSSCRALAQAAAAAERAYINEIDAAITRFTDDISVARAEVMTAAQDKKRMVNEAAAIDSNAIAGPSLAVVMRYLSNNAVALLEVIAFYVVIVILDGAAFWSSGILDRTRAGRKLEKENAADNARYALDTAVSDQQRLLAGAHQRLARRASRSNDALPFIRDQAAQTHRAIAATEGEQLRAAAPLIAAARSIEVMIDAAERAAKTARRAHEINPALGALADDILDRAVHQSLTRKAA